MKALIVALGLSVAVGGCSDEGRTPENEVTLTNGYEVARLFTRDGVSVYRFYDRGEWRYFATRGTVSWAERRTEEDRTVSLPRETQTVELDAGPREGGK